MNKKREERNEYRVYVKFFDGNWSTKAITVPTLEEAKDIIANAKAGAVPFVKSGRIEARKILYTAWQPVREQRNK